MSGFEEAPAPGSDKSPPPPGPVDFTSPPPPPTIDSETSLPPPEAAYGTSPQSDTSPVPLPSDRRSPPEDPTVYTPPGPDPPSNLKQVIIGASVGLGLFLIAMVVVCVLCRRWRNKRKQSDQHIHYHNHANSDPSPARKDHHGVYIFNNNNNKPQQPNNWQMPSPKAPPSPHGGAWPTQPPPPLPLGLNLSSSDTGTTGSGNYSSGPRQHPVAPPSPGLSLGFNKSTFTYEELATATGGFAQGNLLGQGGFGYVHKGVLPNGKEVAVKSLKFGSGQGEREFQSEVEIISRVHHRHLVSLVGYCIAGGQRMLVYEFVPNKTLEHHFMDLPAMDWRSRLRIAIGSAKGLAYLHEDCHPRIIHRDIKTANILIDHNFEAMVADFGLAKLSSDNYTHVSTRVMGTFGYLAPEYASSGKLTEKSDMFSFGVMLLELITGRRPFDPSPVMEDSLVDWARPLLNRALEDNNYEELVDPRLGDNYKPHEMARMVASAASSIRHSARKRPRMSQIVRALEGDVSLDDLNEGVRPGQSSIYTTSSGSSDYDRNAYMADMKKFRQMVAMAGQESGGSDFGTSSNDDSAEMTNPRNRK